MSREPDDRTEVEFSMLCQSITRDGVIVRVAIFRVPAVEERWMLEVIGEDGSSAEWDEPFDTEEEALEAFEAALEAEGITDLTETLH